MSEFRRRLMMAGGGGALPYDAEVEYLESNGNQYIDTGFKSNQDTRLVCEFEITSVIRWSHPFGSLGGTRGSNKILCAEVYSTEVMKSYYGLPSGSNRWTLSPMTGKYVYDFNKNVHTVDGVSKTYTARTFQADYNTLIFSVTSYDGGVSEGAPGKCYYFKIYDNGTLVRDMIPVRVGQVGYMYDKISGTLFGNAGTGDFIFGNDVN